MNTIEELMDRIGWPSDERSELICKIVAKLYAEQAIEECAKIASMSDDAIAEDIRNFKNELK
jgi:hypothetical protein